MTSAFPKLAAAATAPPKYQTFLWFDATAGRWAFRDRSVPYTPQHFFHASPGIITEYAPMANFLVAIPASGLRAAPFDLFHYTSMNAFKSIVRQGVIRASYYASMNDIDEIQTAWKVLYHRIYWFTRHKQVNLSCTKLIWEVFSTDFHTFICSFSREETILSQWRAYAPNDGVSIGLSSSLFAHAQKPGHNYVLRNVEYDPREHMRLLDPIAQVIADHVLSDSSDAEIRDLAHSLRGEFQTIAPFIKNRHFFEEQEVRLITDGTGYELHRRDDGTPWFVEFDLNDLFSTTSCNDCVFGRVTLGPPGEFGPRASDLIAFFAEQRVRWGIIQDYDIPLR